MKHIIDTKFEQGDTIFTIKNDKLFTGVIKSIHVDIESKETIKYWVKNEKDSNFVEEENAYSTKDELIDNL